MLSSLAASFLFRSSPPPTSPPPPSVPDDIPTALAELSLAFAKAIELLVRSPKFATWASGVVAGLIVWHERSLSTAWYVLAIFAAVMGFHATAPTLEGAGALSPVTLSLAAVALLAWPVYRERQRARWAVGFVVAFVALQGVTEAAQVITEAASVMLELAADWSFVPLLVRSVAALVISRKALRHLPAPRRSGHATPPDAQSPTGARDAPVPGPFR